MASAKDTETMTDTYRRNSYVTADYLRRVQAVEDAAKDSYRCGHNGCKSRLAADNQPTTKNPNPMCGPCLTKHRRENPHDKVPQRLVYEKADGRIDGRIKPKCIKGHVIAEVGRNRDGRCKECQRRAKKEWEEKQRSAKEGRTLFYLRGFFGYVAAGTGLQRDVLAALSEKTGIPAPTLTKYMRCEYRCPGDKAEKIAEALGVTVDDLKGEGEQDEG